MAALPTVRQMQAYVAVASLGSFSRAAAELNLSASALSQSIAQLEFLLDAQLLERTSRAVTLTTTGQKFLRKCEAILDNGNAAASEVREDIEAREGSVAVASLSTIATSMFPTVIKRFRQVYPKVSVIVRDDNVDGITQLVKDGSVDLPLRACSPMIRTSSSSRWYVIASALSAGGITRWQGATS